MNSTEARPYAPCPACGALNMAHRRQCYKCLASLGAIGPAMPAAGALVVEEQPAEQAVAALPPNKRRYPRDDVALYSVIVEGDGFPKHDASVRNVSATGIGILSAIEIPENATVRISIVLAGRTYRVDGIVCHTSTSRDGLRTLHLVGIKFIGDVPPLSLLARRR